MRKILPVFLFTAIFFFVGIFLPKDGRGKLRAENSCQQDGEIEDDCTWNGIPLHGKIKFVESFPDIKIQVVESFPGLKVKLVDAFPDDCGEWQIVESFPDFRVQVVESFPDIKVKFVESFPGLP